MSRLQNFSFRRSRSRALLFGTVTAIALGGVVFNTTASMPVHAESALNQSVAAPSFAPLIDRVKGAVVSVRVKTSGPAAEEDGAKGLPKFGDGDPMERLFRRFEDDGRSRRRPDSAMAQGSGFIISGSSAILVGNFGVNSEFR